jgi:hypothetical protein
VKRKGRKLAKLYRLQFIAEHFPCYRVEALKLAIG